MMMMMKTTSRLHYAIAVL